VVLQKAMAAAMACATLVLAPMVLFAAYRLAGGHLDLLETCVAFSGVILRALVVVAASMAAAAWTRTLAQAATASIAVSLTSWAIDVADGFSALAWLGGASAWSIERKLAPFGKGIVPVGSLAWLVVAAAMALGLASVGASFEPSVLRKAAAACAAIVVGAGLMAGASRVARAYDATEGRRRSLPRAVIERLAEVPGPIELDVFFDRDDGRR